MSYEFLSVKHVWADTPQSLNPDETIGILHAGDELRGHMMFDLHRLRQAIIAYEQEFDEERVEIALIRHPESDDSENIPLLALVPRSGADRAIVLAPRKKPDWDGWETGADELIQSGESP